MPKKPELMSPAGDWPQLHAAIESGADAVYFGLKHFSARAKVGFSLDDLPEVMRTLHRRSVKGFVTFNTLIFDHEIEAAKTAIQSIDRAKVDAIIVQDVGIAELVKTIAPDLAVHGSTQMSVTSAQGVELAAALGCSRVVLGRELSLKDIRKIAEQTDVELECFVHGALCVSYSGQCFSSEAWGGRSANRGKCAQACRLSYDLIVDGERRDLGPHRYLLSPGDLYAIEQIPELVEIGVACLKIEGRYKDADYVAVTTAAYREAIDRAVAGVATEDAATQDAQTKQTLEQVYSRGLGAHFMSGVDHQKVVVGRAPRHRGVLVGKVSAISRWGIDVLTEQAIEPGDGLVFDAADWRSPDEPEEGGHVYEVKSIDEAHVRLGFEHGKIDLHRIRSGDLVWRTHQPSVGKSLKRITKTKQPLFTRPIDFEVVAHPGDLLKIVARHESGLSVSFESQTVLEAAQKRALDEATLTEQLGRLGGTAFQLGQITWQDQESVFVPTSLLNEARRTLVSDLEGQLAEQRIEVARPSTTSVPVKETALKTSLLPQLHLLVRSAEQLDAAIECRPASITLDYLELYGLRPSVEKIAAANITARVASPRILKPSEQNIIRFLISLDCEILVRSGGLLRDLLLADIDGSRLIGDFSLNVANQLSLETFRKMGLARITPTYDLNRQQIVDLATAVDPAGIEVIAYSHLPVFHTEHCVFCRFLSEGTDNTNCGHPCESHRIAIKDSAGREHPVMADVGCRNTVFGAEAQTDAAAISAWSAAGIKHFRLEFVYQTPTQIVAIGQAFQQHLEGRISESELAAILSENSPQQTSQGSLYVPHDYKSLVQLH